MTEPRDRIYSCKIESVDNGYLVIIEGSEANTEYSHPNDARGITTYSPMRKKIIYKTLGEVLDYLVKNMDK